MRFLSGFGITLFAGQSLSTLGVQMKVLILAAGYATLEAAYALQNEIWGQGFPEPRFNDTFDVASQRVVGERHLKLRLKRDGRLYEAILFGHSDPLPPSIRSVYRLGVNEYNGSSTVQLMLDHWELP